MQLDFLDAAAPERLKAVLGGEADVVLSDMAANATGHRQTDHLRIMALAEAAARLRARSARAGRKLSSARCCKAAPRPRFSPSSSAISPASSIQASGKSQRSAELYLLARGFRGKAAGDDAPTENA